ncbi:hypothetical protein [Aureimonas glaciei]|jgi:hypothetical protein|uniref:Uncharacterized protein n=1 Tax=Aureimonas glaciei TaxID=1776957 RepID=A0A916XST7_9HYPH|nr:hypothetical protein [Aureimonas glaciei]GGD05933.1 hypothetical protein GCM10011335_06080 [Aureimonas glaciei]
MAMSSPILVAPLVADGFADTPRSLETPMPKTTVNAILTRLSYELHALADAADEFHHLAFSDGGSSNLANADYVRATQGIDLMQQILANLSDYTGCLAMAAPEEMDLDDAQALSLISLSDLRDRLRDVPATEIERQDSGDADIFF